MMNGFKTTPIKRRDNTIADSTTTPTMILTRSLSSSEKIASTFDGCVILNIALGYRYAIHIPIIVKTITETFCKIEINGSKS